MVSADNFVIIAQFDDNIEAIEASTQYSLLQKRIRELAIERVCRSIGADNFVNTLEAEFADKKVEEIPCSRVLRAVSDDCVEIYENIARNGWLGQYIEPKYLGRYIVLKIAAGCPQPRKSNKISSEKSFKDIAVSNQYEILADNEFPQYDETFKPRAKSKKHMRKCQ